MNVAAELHRRAGPIIAKALDMDPGSRRAYVVAACGDDKELCDYAWAQLARHADRSAEEDPVRIGRYHVLDLLGEGGMGRVYRAEQESPRRMVALKVPHAAFFLAKVFDRLDDESEEAAGRAEAKSLQLLDRFKYESEALGRLQHPGIAQIYEADVVKLTFAGNLKVERPFFAMELVQGTPLDEWARRRPDLRERLRLFVKVCDAVSYAHGRSVIHRDLKPANILVTESDEPKVMDFGIAKITDTEVVTEGRATLAGQVLGTPEYMSPELAAGDLTEIDAQSDVYALGVICYQLVAGRLPYTFAQAEPLEKLRIILDKEPIRLGTMSAKLGGDLEAIVHGALEKDKSRRYRSVAELAADVRHFLRDEPISRRPPSRLYGLQKFVRRNRGLSISVSVAVLALIIGAVSVTVFAVRASNRERTAESVVRVLEDVLLPAGPLLIEGQEPTLTQVLARSAKSVPSKLSHDPIAETRLHQLMGVVFEKWSDLDMAEAEFRQAYALMLDHGERTDIMRARHNLACVLSKQGETARLQGDQVLCDVKMREADELYDRLDTRIPGFELNFVNDKATHLMRRHRYAEAEKLYRSVVPRPTEVADEWQLASLTWLAHVVHKQGRHDEAEGLYNAVMEGLDRLDILDPAIRLAVFDNYGHFLSDQRRFEEAAIVQEVLVETAQEILSPRHVRFARLLKDWAYTLYKLEKYEDAESLIWEVIATQAQHVRDERLPPNELVSSWFMLFKCIGHGELLEAEDRLRSRLQRASVSGAEDERHRFALALAVYLDHTGDPAKAIEAARIMQGLTESQKGNGLAGDL